MGKRAERRDLRIIFASSLVLSLRLASNQRVTVQQRHIHDTHRRTLEHTSSERYHLR